MKNAGFTMVELIATLMIVGILAAVAMPRFFDRETFDARAFYDQTIGTLRYAQQLAVATHNNLYVSISGGRIALCYDAACNAKVLPAAGKNSASSATIAACGTTDWQCEAIPSNVTLSASPAVSQFYFDALGRPVGATGNGLATTTISISATGASVPAITVEQETGYVH